MGEHKGKGKLIYFHEDDWKTIEDKASQLNLNTTQYIKRMALNGYIIEYNLDKINDLIYEINKIGININQIVKKSNELDNIYQKDVEELKKEMDNIWHTLKSSLLKLQ